MTCLDMRLVENVVYPVSVILRFTYCCSVRQPIGCLHTVDMMICAADNRVNMENCFLMVCKTMAVCFKVVKFCWTPPLQQQETGTRL